MSRSVRGYFLSVIATAIAATCLAPPAGAQVLYGSIVGNVHDAQGAAIPGATVTVTSKETNLTRDSVTDETGTYNVANVPPGTYDVKVSLQGFREFVQSNVAVAAGQIARVNANLEVGALTETVTVQSNAELLQTDKAEVRSVIRSTEIVNMPLNQYRNYQALLNLVPGTTPAEFQNSQVDTPGRALSTSVNGMNRNNNNTRIDGASSVNIWLPHHTGYVAPAETIETVNVATNNFDVAQGMAGGAAVTVITKSGTNELKGSAFAFRTQDEFNARSFFDSTKPDTSITIGGGTVGGPIVRNKFFYFGSFEGNYERRGRLTRYTVPTERMRNGDFSEVLAVNPNFRLFDPATGNANGTGRQEFGGAVIPSNRISAAARAIQALYPAPNHPGTNNGLQNNYERSEPVIADRDNYDLKVNWNRTSAHQLFAKFSTMQAEVVDLYFLGIEGGGTGDTGNYLSTVGHTWTLSPTLLLDGNFGVNWQDQWARASDFGTRFGSEVFGLPGTNGPDERQTGLPLFNFDTISDLGNPGTWHPVERLERSFTFSQNLTKIAGAHNIRGGVDYIQYQLDHWQPELGRGPRGMFDFSGNITGQPGYTSNAWNQYAAFLLGLTSGFGKSIQFEDMTGREKQFALFLGDRWNATEKLTVDLGLRWEYYPIMTRRDRGLERLEVDSFQVLLGGNGNIPESVGLEPSKTLFAPRLGAAYRLNEDTVVRGGYGITYNPLPWSRPLRGFYPLTIGYVNTAEAELGSQFAGLPLNAGIPDIPLPDVSSGRIPMPRNTLMRTPEVGNVERGRTHQFNAFIERRIPYDISVSAGYVGTSYNGGYADLNLNYAESGGDANRQLFQQAGTADILLWGARTKSRYNSLQIAVNRPFQNGLLLKGAYTLSKARNETDDDGWATLTWSQPSQLHRNYALAGYDRTHNFQMGFVYELPFAKGQSGPVAAVIRDWQINGVFSAYSGRPFTIGGDNTALAQRAGQQTIDLVAPLRRVGDAGPDEVWYDPASFAQPGNKWGNTERNQFRGPANWNLDASVFRAFPVGRYRLEFRAEAANVLNHTQWGNPVTGFTDLNFMRIRTLSPTYTPRRVQFGLRFAF